MGRRICLILLLGLLLTGCTQNKPQPTAPETTEATEEILVTDVITNTAAPVWTKPGEDKFE